MADNTLIILIGMGFLVIGFFWFMLLLTDAIKVRILRKKYNPHDDSSKQGELKRKQGGGEFGRISATDIDNRRLTERDLIAEGLAQFKGRGIQTPAVPSPMGEDSDSRGETSPRPRGIFKKLRDYRNYSSK